MAHQLFGVAVRSGVGRIHEKWHLLTTDDPEIPLSYSTRDEAKRVADRFTNSHASKHEYVTVELPGGRFRIEPFMLPATGQPAFLSVREGDNQYTGRPPITSAESQAYIDGDDSPPLPDFRAQVEKLTNDAMAKIMANREKLVTAWIAETGLLPSESLIVETRTPEGMTMYVRRNGAIQLAPTDGKTVSHLCDEHGYSVGVDIGPCCAAARAVPIPPGLLYSDYAKSVHAADAVAHLNNALQVLEMWREMPGSDAVWLELRESLRRLMVDARVELLRS